jgi:hydroxymethylglutaryl-CoA synthase
LTKTIPSIHPIDDGAAGISGMSVYVPSPRVPLEDWCQWTDNPWEKVQKVVGRSFRVPAPFENVYTMAANAVLRLILQYDVDPTRVGFLGLGTESSTDNAAGAVIVRGMVDRALEELGKPRLSRELEVPEFKHACLGGIYALKSALRYVSCDRSENLAIVVSADVAEYERGSSGEQTQGAGAVAMLVERHPKMLVVDLSRAGSASAYRGPDFRKPFARHFSEEYGAKTKRIGDFPVFSGRYSTYAYLDETVQAVERMVDRVDMSAGKYYQSVEALFFHRPYHHMPISAMSFLYTRGLARSDHHREEFEEICAAAEVSPSDVIAETESNPDLYARVLDGKAEEDPYPTTGKAAGALRRRPEFRDLLERKMGLGGNLVKDLGNLYSAALPAWIAAGFEEACETGKELTGASMVMVGYGSGDAAEAEKSRDLKQSEYEALHDGTLKEGALHDGTALPGGKFEPSNEFAILRVGETYQASFQDLGVEYYGFVASK